jgi:hypothetical protein
MLSSDFVVLSIYILSFVHEMDIIQTNFKDEDWNNWQLSSTRAKNLWNGKTPNIRRKNSIMMSNNWSLHNLATRYQRLLLINSVNNNVYLEQMGTKNNEACYTYKKKIAWRFPNSHFRTQKRVTKSISYFPILNKIGWFTLIMETELVFETLAFDSTLTRLIAGENCITFICRESFKSYKTWMCRQILVKLSSIKFNENPSRRSRVVACEQTDGQTDRAKPIGAFL